MNSPKIYFRNALLLQLVYCAASINDINENYYLQQSQILYYDNSKCLF